MVIGAALDLTELRDVLDRRLAGAPVRLVAIDGRGGSGKSTLGRALAAVWPGSVVIEMDDFYLPVARRNATPAPGENFDRERVVEQVLEPLTHGRAGRYQRYDWDADALAEWHDVPGGGPVIVEGIYSTSKPLQDYFGYCIWVDAPYETRLARGIARDGEAMRSKWVDEWMPAEDAYVRAESPQERADLVVDGGGTSGTPVFVVVEARDGGQR